MAGDLETTFVRGYSESSSSLLMLEKISPCKTPSQGSCCSVLTDLGVGGPGSPAGRRAAPAAYNRDPASVRFVLCVTHPSCPCAHQTWHA